MNDLNIYIRSAHINDIDKIMLIEPLAFGKFHWSKETFNKQISNEHSKFFVCGSNDPISNENKIIGYIGYWLVIDEGHITTVAVSPFYRRRHVADILLYSLINHAIKHQIKWLTLEVRVSNKSAINLYKKYRFKQLGIRKKYYQDTNEDALILWTENILTPEFQSTLESKIADCYTEKFSTDKSYYKILNST